MSQCLTSLEAPALERAGRYHRLRERVPAAMAICAMVCASRALAGDLTFIVNTPTVVTPDFARASSTFPSLLPAPGLPAAGWSASELTAPANFKASPPPERLAFSSTDFRPRKRLLFDTPPTVNAPGEVPMLRGTTVWQRMSDYKSRDRVRLLTLWETNGSTVSIQAGKHGDPSLQWTSRAMNHGGSTRGLFDQWVSASIFNTGGGARGPMWPAGAQAGARLVSAASAAGPGANVK